MSGNQQSARADLWTWSLSGTDEESSCSDAFSKLTALLSDDERKRAASFRADRHRQEFIRAHGRLRQILETYTDCPAERLQFQYGPRDKPFLQPPAPYFNLSHTDDFAALVVTTVCEIGVDIERIRPIERDIAKRFFSDNENESLHPLAGDQWLHAFYRIWTAKEAVIKALGEGLSIGLDSFSVPVSDDDPPHVTFHAETAEPQKWSLERFYPRDGIVGCIAVPHAGPLIVEERTWPPA